MESTETHPGTRHCGAVVVGAGIAGAAAAAMLSAEAGIGDVVLVERESQAAQHASGRSASVLSETSGHIAVCALARLSRPFFERPPAGFADHPLLSPRGLMWVGESGDDDALDALATAGARIRPSVERLDAAGVRRHLPTFAPDAIAAGGVWEPDAMAIDTASVIAGFIRMLRRCGGELLVSSEAIAVEVLGDRQFEVRAGGARLRTAIVVNASGAWADEVARRAGIAQLGCTAYRRTAAIAATGADVSAWPLVMDIASRYYLEPEAGGVLVSPADETPSEPCDAQPDELDVALALERAAAASGLQLRSIRSAWAGLRTFAPDRAPVLGEEPGVPGFWWSVGQGGAGIKTAPAMGAVLAAMAVGADLPGDAAALGITVDTLSPARFRQRASAERSVGG